MQWLNIHHGNSLYMLNSNFPIEIKKINVKNSDKNVHGVYVKGGNPRNACRFIIE